MSDTLGRPSRADIFRKAFQLEDRVRDLERELAGTRQRHAEAVEQAWVEAYRVGIEDTYARMNGRYEQDESAAWLASEAKKGLI